MAVTYLYPSWLYRLLDRPGAEFSALQFLTYGSAPIAPARLRQALARFGPRLMQNLRDNRSARDVSARPGGPRCRDG
ncbi:hypothetical protein H4W33_002003 [Kibdelosporangium phytohabitans]|nr:hypothetical protein [Kibdelosporangium phytohabitans]